MKELPISIQQKIDRYQPVTVGDFTLYPVTVEKSRLFSMARPALEFAQQSLPVALLNVPILDAFYKLELQSAEQSGAVTGISILQFWPLRCLFGLWTALSRRSCWKTF